MKKVVVLMLTLMLCGCGTRKKEFKYDYSDKSDTTQEESVIEDQSEITQDDDEEEVVSDVNLSSYYGTYEQDEIVYVYDGDYKKESDYSNSALIYTIKAKSFTFETDLIYKSVSYKSVAITEDDRQIVPGIKAKFKVLSKKENLGITIMIDDTAIYIANNALVHDGYTYVAKMKRK